jgi:beta-xylosidase
MVSSSEIIKIDDAFYMLYEGIRGAGSGDGGDAQFGLGLARSTNGQIDGGWETYPGNPILVDLPGNVGLGHADVVIDGGITYLYTSLDGVNRVRLRLVWR